MNRNSRIHRWTRACARARTLLPALALSCCGVAFAGLFRVSEDDEVKVARELERKVYTQYRVFPDESAKLGEMSRRLLGAGPWPKKFGESFSFWVVEDPRDPKQLNAFAAPGGFICFYRALYERLGAQHGDDAVAAVLAHEIEHAANHHSARAYENQAEKQLLFGLLLAASGAGDTVVGLTDTFLGLKALRYSRAHENQSDERGIVRMWRAGYNTEKFASVFELFASLGKDKPPVYFSTHPADKDRIERARQRHLALAARQPGVTLAETSVFHRDGKPLIKAGWIAGVTDNTVVVAPDGKSYRVSKDIFFDHAIVRAKREELAEGSAVKFEKALADPFNQTVGVGSVTAVSPASNSVTVDLGRWQQLAPGVMMNLVQTRVDDVRDARNRVERRRTVKTVAAAKVTEVREREATLEIVSFADSAADRFSIRDVQRGMEARLASWPN